MNKYDYKFWYIWQSEAGVNLKRDVLSSDATKKAKSEVDVVKLVCKINQEAHKSNTSLNEWWNHKHLRDNN